MNNLIFDVDTQKDFMLKEGKLYIPEAESIIPNITKLLDDTLTNGNTYIISTMDMHPMGDKEFEKFPEHCIMGTTGAEKIPETIVYAEKYRLEVPVGQKISSSDIKGKRQFFLHKATYDIWDKKLGNPKALYDILSSILPQNIIVCGVATDICCLAAVKGLLSMIGSINPYCGVLIDRSAMKGLAGEKEAIEEMISLGAGELLS